jgi:hypothetical protein
VVRAPHGELPRDAMTASFRLINLTTPPTSMLGSTALSDADSLFELMSRFREESWRLVAENLCFRVCVQMRLLLEASSLL